MLLIIFIFNLILYTFAKNEIYMGSKVYGVKLETQEQQEKLNNLKSDKLDFWKKPCFKYDRAGQVMVSASDVQWFEDTLQQLNITKEIIINDVYSYLQERDKIVQYSGQREYMRNASGFDFNGYYRYSEILDYMKSLQFEYSNSTGVNVTYIESGVTDEGRPLAYLEMTSSTNSQDKPTAIIEAGIIPREWITVPVAVKIARELLRAPAQLLSEFKWIIVPVVNPDGYEYTHTNLRLWSKSRSTRSNLGMICHGVNLNRNFDIDWQTSDSSTSPCSHIYGGIAAFSEPESRFIKSLVDNNKDKLKLYVSLQNGGGYLAYPWQYEKAASGMFRQHYVVGREMAQFLGNRYIVDVGSLASGGRASGTSGDYAMENDAMYTFNINIEGFGEDGVMIPESNIGTIADDVWRAVFVAARAAST